jgi:hypothetical protein
MMGFFNWIDRLFEDTEMPSTKLIMKELLKEERDEDIIAESQEFRD